VKARLLLNHDTVFLAEILSCLGGQKTEEWPASYNSFNCLNLPKDTIPVSLEWAAAANVILTEFKIADHITDGEGYRYKLGERLFSQDFKKAAQFLVERDFPLKEVTQTLASQSSRESAAISLDDLSFPTAQTTAIFFREGVRHIGRNDLADMAFDLGFSFGKLVYLIDAFEDHAADIRRGRFNAFQAVYGSKRGAASFLTQTANEITAAIHLLPISVNQKALFADRLSDNLRRHVRTELPIIHSPHICVSQPKQTLADRWHAAAQKARELARDYSWQMPLVFTFVFLFVLLAPAAQAREARSARECFDLGFNLMFIGSVFGSVIAMPRKLFNEIPPEAGEVAAKAAKGGVKGSSSSGCCDGDCCDCCDCCDACGSCDC
jgi:hypothetical protein